MSASSNDGEPKNSRSGGNSGKKTVTQTPRSEVGIDALRGRVFLFGVQEGQQERFIKSKKALAMYLGTTSDCGKMLYNAIMKGEEPKFKEPDDPDKDATPAQVCIKFSSRRTWRRRRSTPWRSQRLLGSSWGSAPQP
jgi:hypothetical protein